MGCIVRNILLAAALGASIQAQPHGSGVISGTVFNKVSGEPVRKAIVLLSWLGTPRSWASTLSDSAGQFSFTALPPGRYELRASKDGMGAAAFGAASASDFPELLTLADGETRRGIELRLFRPSSIAGAVLDVDGDPLIHAEVSVFREGYPRGIRELIPRSTARTNDRGEYRISNLEPARYYVAATQYMGAGFFRGPDAPPDLFARQFYGGAMDWKRASPLNVGSGEQLSGIDFHLTTIRGFHVRGRVTGVPEMPAQSEGPTGGVAVELIAIGDGAQARMRSGASASPPEYGFDLPQVAPGAYYLRSELRAGTKLYNALQKLDLTQDPGEITLALAPATDLKGRVTLEGEVPEPVKSFHVNLTRGDGLFGRVNEISVQTAPDGSFTLEQVPPGVWDIGVSPIPKGGYVKAMRLGKQDVLTEEMEITAATDAPLNIVVSSRGAVVEGEVQGGADLRRTVAIQLAPAGKYHNVISFYGSVPTDAKGKFTITGVTPGRYKVFAFEHLPAGGMQNPEVTAKLDALGESLEIGEGAHVESHPKVITAEQLKEALQ